MPRNVPTSPVVVVADRARRIDVPTPPQVVAPVNVVKLPVNPVGGVKPVAMLSKFCV